MANEKLKINYKTQK